MTIKNTSCRSRGHAADCGEAALDRIAHTLFERIRTARRHHRRTELNLVWLIAYELGVNDRVRALKRSTPKELT